VEALVAAGCDTVATDVEGCTGLMRAANNGHTALVVKLIDLGVAEVGATSDSGSTAFLIACTNGSVDCVEALVAAGCDTTATNHNGCTGLMYAANQGQAAVVERLLQLGLADLEAADSDGFTAFLFACTNLSVDCVDVLVAAGCDTSATDDNGVTGLIAAASSGHQEVVERLLALGVAEPEAQAGEQGTTAFLFACGYGHLGCVEALVAAGCNTNARTSDGRTATQVAEAKDHTAVVDFLRVIAVRKVAAVLRVEVGLGLGRIVALYHLLILFIPESLTYSVPVFLRRQCDRTLGRAAGGAARLRGGDTAAGAHAAG
jgi:ankyrin repeat protein